MAWYPGTVLFEATNLSVGRGTDAPFRQVGAPWLAVPRGRAWRPVTFTPQSPGDGKLADTMCRGLLLNDYDRRRDRSVGAALRLLDAIAAANPDSLRVDARGMAIRLGKPWHAGFVADNREVDDFKRQARPYLLYR